MSMLVGVYDLVSDGISLAMLHGGEVDGPTFGGFATASSLAPAWSITIFST